VAEVLRGRGVADHRLGESSVVGRNRCDCENAKLLRGYGSSRVGVASPVPKVLPAKATHQP
jgi:hypothetical protein